MDWRLQILGALATAVCAILAGVTPLLVRAAIRYIENKTKIDLSDAQEAAIERAAVQAVAWVEEQSRKNLSARGVPLPSDQKFEQAKSFVRDALARQGHVDLSVLDDAALRGAIESAVHMVRSATQPPTLVRVSEPAPSPSSPPSNLLS